MCKIGSHIYICTFRKTMNLSIGSEKCAFERTGTCADLRDTEVNQLAHDNRVK